MTREILTDVLSRIPKVQAKDDAFEVDPECRLTVYLGEPGRAMEVRRVRRLEFANAFIILRTDDDSGTMFVGYESVLAVGSKAPQADSSRKTGFS